MHRHPREGGAAPALAVALALPVHLLTLAFVALGVLLLWPGTEIFAKVVGGLCLVLAYGLRPKLSGERDGAQPLAARDVPETVALVGEVAAAVGSRPPTRIEVSSDVRPDIRLTGVRGATLSIGAPLWAALTGPERVAMLGHQLGHLARHVTLTQRITAGAAHTLTTWEAFTTVERTGFAVSPDAQLLSQSRTAGVAGTAGLLSDVVAVLLWPLRMLVAGYRRLLQRTVAPWARSTEYAADAAAVRAAGSEAATALLEVMMALPGLEAAVGRAGAGHTDIGAAIHEWRAAYDVERDDSALHADAVADDVPESEQLPEPEVPHVEVDPDRWTRIDHELERAVAAGLRRSADDYLYPR